MSRIDLVRIEHAVTVDDVREIASLYPAKTAAQQEQMVRSSLQPELQARDRGERAILLARLGDMVVGTVQVVWDNADEDPVLQAPGSAVIHHLRTHPDYQGRGIGTQLMKAAEDLATARGVTRLNLGVEPGNTRARRLYLRWGFSEFYRYHDETGEQLLGMRKRLGDS